MTSTKAQIVSGSPVSDEELMVYYGSDRCIYNVFEYPYDRRASAGPTTVRVILLLTYNQSSDALGWDANTLPPTAEQWLASVGLTGRRRQQEAWRRLQSGEPIRVVKETPLPPMAPPPPQQSFVGDSPSQTSGSGSVQALLAMSMAAATTVWL